MLDHAESPATPLHLPERRIASLPIRARSASESVETPSKSSSSQLLRPTDQISRETPSGENTHHLSDTFADTSGFLLPRPNSARASYQFGQQASTLQAKGQTAFTFRALHNVTPRPPSPEPSEVDPPASQSQTYPPMLGFQQPALPIVEQELPQPLHTLYSDEKIVAENANASIISGIADFPESTLTSSIPSSSRSRSEIIFTPSTLSRRSSDTSDGSEASHRLESYDIRDEVPPTRDFFTPAFQSALQSGLDVARTAVASINRLAGCPGFGDDLARLLKDAKDLSAFESSDTRTIAVLGDTGEGRY